jgi:SMI1 / KNR4 family (SUKH-1)
MRASDDDRLIHRLGKRNADRERATDGGIHARKPFPPIAPDSLQFAERAVGFKLPELLRAIYLRVGNGGFGPEYGIIGTKGGASLDGCTLETCYQNMLRLKSESAVWRWPELLLPVANYGCGMWSCVDCEGQTHPMILWDPNNLDSDLDGEDAQLNWGNSFWDQGLSFREWLEGWLAETQQPEPKWPSDDWMRKRLGITLQR